MRIMLLVALWLGLASAAALAQDKAPPPKQADGKPVPKKLVLTVGSTHRLQMSKQQIIKTVINDNETVIQVLPSTDPRSVLIKALMPGRARLTLISEDGKKETLNFGKPADNVALTKR